MENTIRTGQLLSPFGIGQIVTFPEEVSLMVCGLDLWDKQLEDRKKSASIGKIKEEVIKIKEERLQKLLGVDFFRKPFPYKTETDGEINTYLKIPGVRFPGWHHCVNPGCGRMKRIPLNYPSKTVDCLKSEGGCGQKMIPVRFVAACEKGHIQDVPFKEWVHNGPVSDDEKHELRYSASSGSGDLGSVFIKCSCGEARSLAGIMNVRKDETHDIVFDSALGQIGMPEENDMEFSYQNPNDPSKNPSGEFCKGNKPWLGNEGMSKKDNCGNHLRVLIKGGSNIHYSNLQSALYLPQTTENVDEYVQKVIDEYPGGLDRLKELHKQQADGEVLKLVLEDKSVVQNGLIDIKELVEGLINEFDNAKEERENYEETDIRWDEYQYILEGRNSENSDLKAVVEDFQGYKHQDFLKNIFPKLF